MSRLFFVMAGVVIGLVIYLTRKRKESDKHGKSGTEQA